jgi:hypothetical protein
MCPAGLRVRLYGRNDLPARQPHPLAEPAGAAEEGNRSNRHETDLSHLRPGLCPAMSTQVYMPVLSSRFAGDCTLAASPFGGLPSLALAHAELGALWSAPPQARRLNGAPHSPFVAYRQVPPSAATFVRPKPLGCPLATAATHDTFPRMKAQATRGTVSPGPRPQREQLIAFLRERGIARLAEIRRAGITAATVSRLQREGVITRLSRGLYQLADAEPEGNHSLAEAAKRVPKGVICLVSALAFHGITDQMPRRVWIAIGSKDWKPQIDYPPLRIVRFADKFLRDGIEMHDIEGVSVPIFSVAKTIADVFRHRRSVGTDVAVPALKEALRHRKTTPSEISACAMRSGVWNALRPYLEALTADG